MYRPKLYDVTNKKKVLEFIRQYSFGILVSYDGKIPLATHMPIEALSDNPEGIILYAHVSRANQQWNSIVEGKEVLVIFNGPHTYVSSKWYESHNVPTWNYKAAHIYGNPEIIEGKQLLDHLKRMVTKYEKPSPDPLHWEDMPEGMINRQLQGIVGFRIKVTRMEAAFKLSQNRNQADYENIITKLREREDAESHTIANEMEFLNAELF